MRFPTLLACLLLAACSDTGDGASDAALDTTERPDALEPLSDTLDRARGVEDTLRGSAAERRRQLDAAEGR